MSSPLGSLHYAASTAAQSLPFNSGKWLFSGVTTPLASPPASAPTQQIASPRPRLMQPYDSYHPGPAQSHSHSHSGYEVPGSATRQLGLVRQESPREPRQREKTPTGMLLSSDCDHCGNKVSIEVPRWMTDAMDAGGRVLHDSVRRAPLEGPPGGPHSGGRQWREGAVAGAIGIAKAIKSSPIPPLFFAFMKALVGMMIYLDRRFELHQRLAAMVIAVLEGLVEIEREVGLLRKGGEGLSVLWEAFVRGSIALARTEAAPASYQQHQHPPAPAPTSSFAAYAAPASNPSPATQPAWHANSLPVSPYQLSQAHNRPSAPSPSGAGNRLPYLEPYVADSEGESEDGPHFRLDDIDPRSPSYAAYPTPELLHPGPIALNRTSSQSLRRQARSTPSLKEAAKADRRDAAAGFPFPGAKFGGAELTSPRAKQGRQRSRSEHSAEGALLERTGSGMRSKVMSMTGLASEAERGWMGKFVAGAAERMGAI